MNLSQIKKKYRDILEESDNSSSSAEFDNTFDSVFKGFQNKHKQAQSVNKQNMVPQQRKVQINLHTEIIQLKERLGQANQKLQTKDCELKSQCDIKGEISQQKRILEKHLQTFQEQIQKKDRQLVELKAYKINYQARLKELQQQFMDKDLDKEMLQKQVVYYETEQNKFKEIIKQKDEEIKSLTLKSKGVNSTKTQNERLKNDINRLAILLEEKKIFKPTNKFNLSYLGKGDRSENESWYSRDLIGLAQRFLRKHSIPQKSTLPALVKLLSSTQQSAKVDKSVDTRKYQHRNSSVTIKDISVILPKHSVSYKLPSGDNYDSIFHSKSKMQQSTFNHTIEDEGRLFNCREVIVQYKSSVDQLLNKKAMSRNKIRKLTDWLVVSIDEVIKQNKVQL